jgi:hypothetical protein
MNLYEYKQLIAHSDNIRVLRSEQKANKEDFCNLVEQVITQHPQPNGRIYLHGDPITKHRVNQAAVCLTIVNNRIAELKNNQL